MRAGFWASSKASFLSTNSVSAATASSMAVVGSSGFNLNSAARRSRTSTTSRVLALPRVPSGPQVSLFQA